MERLGEYYEKQVDATETLILYENYRGDIGVRRIRIMEFWYGRTPFHENKQWFLKGYDLDKEAIRDFAMIDIIKFKYHQDPKPSPITRFS